jgi:hypothetical protein
MNLISQRAVFVVDTHSVKAPSPPYNCKWFRVKMEAKHHKEWPAFAGIKSTLTSTYNAILAAPYNVPAPTKRAAKYLHIRKL